MLAVGLMSFAALLLELGLTRLFSVVLFYHFAFLAISVALLGLGAGAVFAYLRREWLERWTVSQLGVALCAANAVLIFVVLEVVLHTSVSLHLDWPNFWRLTLLYLVGACRSLSPGCCSRWCSRAIRRASRSSTAPICWAARWPAWRWCRC